MAESTIVMSKQANKLDGSLKAKAFTFLSKLAADDAAPGLHIEPVKRCCDSRVRTCLLYTSPSPRDATLSRMPSSA